jgi:hypothetical protein
LDKSFESAESFCASDVSEEIKVVEEVNVVEKEVTKDDEIQDTSNKDVELDMVPVARERVLSVYEVKST